MKLLPFFLALLLVGCSTQPIKPEEKIVVKTEYIIKLPPDKLMELPQKPTKVDVDNPNLKQSDAAKFIQGTEDYVAALENKLIAIAKFFHEEQTKVETKK